MRPRSRRTARGRRAWAAAASLALLSAWEPAAGQQPAAPVFRAEVDVVAVDVNVVDENGRPIRGLAPDDFTLRIDGQPRRVLSADFVDLGEPLDPPTPPRPAQDFSTNEGVRNGRVLVIVVDEGALRPGAGRHVIRSADRLLDGLGPDDRAGLVTMPGGGPQAELTTEHARVRNALKRVNGRASFAGGRISLTEAHAFDEGRQAEWYPVVVRECGMLAGTEFDSCRSDVEGEAGSVAQGLRHQSQVSMRGLGLLMEGLRQVEGPKTVVLLTQALRSERVGELRELAVAAAAARVAFYGIEIDEGGPDAAAPTRLTTGPEDTDLITRDLYRLASLSRGDVFRSAGSAGPFDRIVREMSGFYLIGFEPEGRDRDGGDHVIEVSVRRPDATVRARRSLPLAPATPTDARNALAAALTSPAAAGELPLRVATYALQEPSSPGKVRVLVSAEIGRGDVEPSGLAVGFVMADATGKPVATSAHQLGPEAGSGTPGPIPYLGRAVVDPGEYTLRLAAVDARGRKGSVTHRVGGALTSAGPIAMADLMLAPPADRPGASLRPGVEARGDGAALAALVELYGAETELERAAVSIEVAVDASGPALVQAPVTLAPGDGRRRVAQGLVPISLLPPGPYVARAVLTLGGRPTGQVVRSFRVTNLAAGAASASPLEGFVPASLRFDARPFLRPEMLGPSLDDLRRRSGASLPAGVSRAIEQAAAGRPEALVDGTGDAPAGTASLSFLRGVGLLARGQHGSAFPFLRTAVREHPDFVPATVYLAAAAAAQGQDQQAVGAWNTALLMESPGSPLVHAALADAHLRLGQPREALDVLEPAVATWPEDATLRRRLGLAYALAGRSDEALPVLESHLQASPDDTDALFAMLRLLYEPLRTGAPGADRPRFERYARAYVEAKAPQHALVAQWLRTVDASGTP